MICWQTTGLRLPWYALPAHSLLRLSTTPLSAATYPPIPPKLFVNVPIITSTLLGSTPVYSQHPRPVRPMAPMLCASSRYRYAPYLLQTVTTPRRSQYSPSME